MLIDSPVARAYLDQAQRLAREIARSVPPNGGMAAVRRPYPPAASRTPSSSSGPSHLIRRRLTTLTSGERHASVQEEAAVEAGKAVQRELIDWHLAAPILSATPTAGMLARYEHVYERFPVHPRPIGRDR